MKKAATARLLRAQASVGGSGRLFRLRGKTRSLSGQAAVEVLAYASFFMFVFAIGIAAFFQMQSQEISRAEYAYAQEIAEEFADYVNTAYVAGPGFREEVTLPPELLGKDYEIRVSSRGTGEATGFVYVSWPAPAGSPGKPSAIAPTPATNFKAVSSGDFIKVDGDFIVIKPANGGKIRIENNLTGTENNENVIYISKA